jgi:hypothetical protein
MTIDSDTFKYLNPKVMGQSMGWTKGDAHSRLYRPNQTVPRQPHQVSPNEFYALPEVFRRQIIEREPSLQGELDALNKGGNTAGVQGAVPAVAKRAAARQLTVALVYQAMKSPDSAMTAAIVDFRAQYPAGSQPIIDGIRNAVLAVVQFNEEEGTVKFATPDASSFGGDVPEDLREVVMEAIAFEQKLVQDELMKRVAAGHEM